MIVFPFWSFHTKTGPWSVSMPVDLAGVEPSAWPRSRRGLPVVAACGSR